MDKFKLLISALFALFGIVQIFTANWQIGVASLFGAFTFVWPLAPLRKLALTATAFLLALESGAITSPTSADNSNLSYKLMFRQAYEVFYFDYKFISQSELTPREHASSVRKSCNIIEELKEDGKIVAKAIPSLSPDPVSGFAIGNIIESSLGEQKTSPCYDAYKAMIENVNYVDGSSLLFLECDSDCRKILVNTLENYDMRLMR